MGGKLAPLSGFVNSPEREVYWLETEQPRKSPQRAVKSHLGLGKGMEGEERNQPAGVSSSVTRHAACPVHPSLVCPSTYCFFPAIGQNEASLVEVLLAYTACTSIHVCHWRAWARTHDRSRCLAIGSETPDQGQCRDG